MSVFFSTFLCVCMCLRRVLSCCRRGHCFGFSSPRCCVSGFLFPSSSFSLSFWLLIGHYWYFNRIPRLFFASAFMTFDIRHERSIDVFIHIIALHILPPNEMHPRSAAMQPNQPSNENQTVHKTREREREKKKLKAQSNKPLRNMWHNRIHKFGKER